MRETTLSQQLGASKAPGLLEKVWSETQDTIAMRRLALKTGFTVFFCNTDSSTKEKMNKGHQTLPCRWFHIVLFLSELNSVAMSCGQAFPITANTLGTQPVHLTTGTNVTPCYIIQVYNTQLPSDKEIYYLICPLNMVIKKC